jgi:hypothetical protein
MKQSVFNDGNVSIKRSEGRKIGCASTSAITMYKSRKFGQTLQI